MILKKISMIAADTTRSRIYLQSMIRNNLYPNFVIVLKNKKNKILPGQIKNQKSNKNQNEIKITQDCWSEVNNNLFEPIRVTLKKSFIDYKEVETTNIHNVEVIKTIRRRSESTFIYSGFGGVILKKELFETGKNFLHIHGGYLPSYKGSTTNYYSLITENKMGASAIFLNEKIDSGPILKKLYFPPPKNRDKIDHIFDSAARAKVLIVTLKEYKTSGKFDTQNEISDGEIYFIIHPILKHIAILANK
jgi:methionyl-tRNA formyltransferase